MAPSSSQSAAARARAYSEAVRASKNANGNIAAQIPPVSPGASSTPTSPLKRAPPSRTTSNAKRAATDSSTKSNLPKAPQKRAPTPTKPPVARSSSSASSSASLGTRIRQEAAQVAAELLASKPTPSEQPPAVEDVLAADGQAWMQFLQRTAAQLEQEVAKLPADNASSSTRGTRSRHTTGSTAGSGISRPESPLPTSTAAALLSSSVGAPMLSDDADAPPACSFLAGGGEGDTGASAAEAAGSLSQLLRALTDGPDSAQEGVVGDKAVETPIGDVAVALQEPQDGAPVPAPKAERYRPDDAALLPTSPRLPEASQAAKQPDSGASGSKAPAATHDAAAANATKAAESVATKPLKSTAAGSRLIKNAPARSTATVRQLADALNGGLKVHKRWQREGRRRRHGSHRLVQAGVVDGQLVVEYMSGCWGRRASGVVKSVELSLGEWKTVLLLHTDRGVLRLAPFSADACAEWVLGINTLLHLTAKELPASQVAIHLPWHKDVQVATDTPL